MLMVTQRPCPGHWRRFENITPTRRSGLRSSQRAPPKHLRPFRWHEVLPESATAKSSLKLPDDAWVAGTRCISAHGERALGVEQPNRARRQQERSGLDAGRASTTMRSGRSRRSVFSEEIPCMRVEQQRAADALGDARARKAARVALHRVGKDCHRIGHGETIS